MDNSQNHIKIKRIVLISILVSLAVILSVFDKAISTVAFPFLPTAKIGLANIVILIGVYRFTFKETLLMVILKCVLTGFILGSPISFIISLIASSLSFFGMYIFCRILKESVSAISISVIGGFLHIMGQLFTIDFLYKIGDAVFYYGGVLIFVSLITSIIIGFIGMRMNKFIDQIENVS
jgi:heptaprenyl diphosphate synthase